MATANIYTLVEWTANDGSQDSLGSLSAPVQVTYPLNQIIDKSLNIPDSTSTQIYDASVDGAWAWMAMYSADTNLSVVYVGSADTSSSTFVLNSPTISVFVSNKTLPYNADDQIRLVAATENITKMWVYQTSGLSAALRFVIGL